MRKLLQFLILFFIFSNTYSQTKFQFYGADDVKQKVKFQLINNLIIIPLQINGQKLNFILDTGVNKTILFNLTRNDSLGLNNVKRIQLKGLGIGKPVDALLSKNNMFQVGDLINPNEDLYVILRDQFNMSAKMGLTVHGIIGYDLLKSVILQVDYKREIITFYNPKKYNIKKCRKCEEFPLEFYRNKPYIKALAGLDTLSNKKTEIKLLIDSGGSDALWFFEGTHEDIKRPKKFFRDILGEGLSGTIYGNRSKIPEFKLGRFIIENPTVSFLDTLSTVNARQFKSRNGSLGGNILKRFKVWIDYPNRRILFKKNGSLKGGFYYNMSGLVIVYHGQELITKKEDKLVDPNIISDRGLGTSNMTISFVTRYYYQFKPTYKISEVIESSPGSIAGLLKGDILKKLNGKPAHSYTLEEINGIFHAKPNKKIFLEIERHGVRHKFKFRLKKRI